MITFQPESWATFYPDARHLFPFHWQELAVNQDQIALDCDVEGYETLGKIGRLFILTARDEGCLVGYLTCFLMHHLHYKGAGLMALTDMYFVLPEYRHGAGAKLFIEWVRMMKERGVVQMITSCKLHQDHSEFLKRLGWKHTDNTFIKCLRENKCP